MPNDLISTDPIIAQNFYLELDGVNILLSTVSALTIDMDVAEMHQNGAKGVNALVKTRGQSIKVPDIEFSRMAPMDAASDPIWQWFRGVRSGGFKGTDRGTNRKTGSIVFFDTQKNEVGRFTFHNAWVKSIATDGVDTTSSEPLKETITVVAEWIDRTK